MALNKRGSWGLCWLVVAAFVLSACSHQSLQEPVPSFTSVFPYESREVGNYSVDDHTKAPLQWVVRAWVKTDAATLYAKSINLEGILENVTWNKEGAPSIRGSAFVWRCQDNPFCLDECEGEIADYRAGERSFLHSAERGIFRAHSDGSLSRRGHDRINRKGKCDHMESVLRYNKAGVPWPASCRRNLKGSWRKAFSLGLMSMAAH